jgi:homoserine kinase
MLNTPKVRVFVMKWSIRAVIGIVNVIPRDENIGLVMTIIIRYKVLYKVDANPLKRRMEKAVPSGGSSNSSIFNK